MACQCNCCGGACCYDFAGTPTCTFETCAECEDLNGEWQGPGTECTGANTDECPCDPPADHTECEKCVDGTPTERCAEGEYCCDGVCEGEPCEEFDCDGFDSAGCNIFCGATGCSDDQQCVEGTVFGDPPETNTDCQEYYAACCPVCILSFDELGNLDSVCGELP